MRSSAPTVRIDLSAMTVESNTHNLPTIEETAAVIHIECSNKSFRNIVLVLRNSNRNDSLRHGPDFEQRFQRISQAHVTYMPIHYVLLLSHGTHGWHWSLRISFSFFTLTSSTAAPDCYDDDSWLPCAILDGKVTPCAAIRGINVENGVHLRWTNLSDTEQGSERPDSAISVIMQSNWGKSLGYGEAKIAELTDDKLMLAWDLCRLGHFSKETINISSIKSSIPFQVKGHGISIYTTALSADGI
ncbi:uncharacterized protein RHIMIDRAFT_294674 [Rhizopus microsporus ATCC 52813]|uniref:Uncharacterized protein n=1 Tax=Rhizopus microsporus ATCC 52813 TaxID=1340429 RepID=A0A2G4SLA1_RHIZD|nr:uncharacterized protein RHIMIDRAFT_294674 [Rhizopus microsporus ATCC 52813]PHZ09166.1 hypothetical protein RHIMIDRAFT_294674 [Rhizopus microsporus ATCC 52813]